MHAPGETVTKACQTKLAVQTSFEENPLTNSTSANKPASLGAGFGAAWQTARPQVQLHGPQTWFQLFGSIFNFNASDPHGVSQAWPEEALQNPMCSLFLA